MPSWKRTRLTLSHIDVHCKVIVVPTVKEPSICAWLPLLLLGNKIFACAHIAGSSGRKQMCEHKAQKE